MADLTKVASKFIAITPTEFSDLATLKSTTDATIQAITGASGTAAVLGTEMVTVLGNIYLVVLYQLS